MHAEGMDQSTSEDTASAHRRRADVRMSSVVFRSNPSAIVHTRTIQTNIMESGGLDSYATDADLDAELEGKPLPGIPAIDTSVVTVSMHDPDVIEIKKEVLV